MPAPVATARVVPTGDMLKNGYRSLITVALDPDIDFWERTVKPPGLDGGDPINTTTMHNTTLRTFSPSALTTMTPCTVTVAYASAAFEQIQAILNKPTTITLTLPDGGTVAFYGYVHIFEPNDLSEGNLPEATLTIQPTNQDPTDGSEQQYVYTAPAAV